MFTRRLSPHQRPSASNFEAAVAKMPERLAMRGPNMMRYNPVYPGLVCVMETPIAVMEKPHKAIAMVRTQRKELSFILSLIILLTS